MNNLLDNMATALSAAMYYITAAISTIVKNRYLMFVSVIAAITILMRPTSFKLGRLFSYSTSRK